MPGTIGGYPVPSPMATPAPGQTLAPGMVPTSQPGVITGALSESIIITDLYMISYRINE